MAQHTQDTQAQAVAAVLAGETYERVAQRLKTPVGTVKAWVSRYRTAGGLQRLQPEKRDDLGVLVGDYLAANLAALRAQAELAGNVEFLKSAPVGKLNDLAVLHGVLNDKAVRVLAAIRPAEADDQ